MRSAVQHLFVCFFSTLAQVSLRDMVRLKTREPEAESGSTQKYPNRSN